MALSSMTGFARAEGGAAKDRWVWEVRSVNGRGLDMRFRLPPGLESLEPDLRKAISDGISRGSVSATLTLERGDSGPMLRVNRDALEAAIQMVELVRKRADCEKPRAEGILALRGVIEHEDEFHDEEAGRARAAAIASTFREAIAELKEARDAEGAALASVVSLQIAEVDQLVKSARASASASLTAIKAKIAQQLTELLVESIPEERIAEEAAMLAIRADVREELDRIEAHIAAARALLLEKEAVGRRFDFLSQEFNREANTLCSKAQDMALKTIGLELKTVIDRMREQVQNIE
jgi:uncharacterized protein (TIGR00255 family)